jgi:hypothetical protein
MPQKRARNEDGAPVCGSCQPAAAAPISWSMDGSDVPASESARREREKRRRKSGLSRKQADAGLKVSFRGDGQAENAGPTCCTRPLPVRPPFFSSPRLFYFSCSPTVPFPLFRAVSLVLCSLPRFDFARTSSLEEKLHHKTFLPLR